MPSQHETIIILLIPILCPILQTIEHMLRLTEGTTSLLEYRMGFHLVAMRLCWPVAVVADSLGLERSRDK